MILVIRYVFMNFFHVVTYVKLCNCTQVCNYLKVFSDFFDFSDSKQLEAMFESDFNQPYSSINLKISSLNMLSQFIDTKITQF